MGRHHDRLRRQPPLGELPNEFQTVDARHLRSVITTSTVRRSAIGSASTALAAPWTAYPASRSTSTTPWRAAG